MSALHVSKSASGNFRPAVDPTSHIPKCSSRRDLGIPGYPTNGIFWPRPPPWPPNRPLLPPARKISACGAARCPCGAQPGAYRHQHRAAFAANPSTVNAPPRPSPPTPKFLKPAARPKRRKKRSSQQKPQEGSCGALLVLRSSIEPASERPTCSRTRAPISDSRRSAQREAQQSTKRSTAKHGVISGGEQARVRTSCRHLGIELRIASAARYQNFPPAALRSCARGA